MRKTSFSLSLRHVHVLTEDIIFVVRLTYKKSSTQMYISSNSTLCVLSQASAHNKNLDVGANIFIGNLDPEIDEKLLYDTFSAFGVILQTPKVSKPSPSLRK